MKIYPWKITGAGALGLVLGLLLRWHASAWKGRAAHRHTALTESAPAAPPPVSGPRETDKAADATGAAASRGQGDSLRKLIGQLAGDGEGSGMDTFSTDQFASYLERHQRDARSLLAVYAFTGDKALLREAYEKHPENLLVAEQALSSLDLSTDEKLALLEKVRAAHPDNALGDLMTANIFLKEGKKEEFMRLLQSGLGKTSLDYGEREQRLALREALMSVGKSPTEARVLSSLHHTPFPYQIHTAISSGRKEMQRMLKEGGEEQAFALAGQMLSFASHLGERKGSNMMEVLVAHSLRHAVLAGLPAEVEIGETRQTAGELLKVSDEKMNEYKAYSSAVTKDLDWHLQHFDEAGVELYFQIAEERGERAALEWAESYNGPAPVK